MPDMIPLSQKKDLCCFVKFLAALLIVNGHLFLFGNSDCSMKPFMNLGACCVAVFFFFSGYGLSYSYQTKGNKYLTGFFKKRILKILLPLVVAYAITLPIYSAFVKPISIRTLIETLSWGGPYLKYSWFVSEIIIVYILFYLCMKLPVKYSYKLITLTLFIFILIAGLLLFKQPLWYSVSLPGFILGLWYSNFEDNILKNIKKLPILSVIVISSIVWIITWQWNIGLGEILTPYRYAFLAMYLAPVSFAVMIMGILDISTPLFTITSC